MSTAISISRHVLNFGVDCLQIILHVQQILRMFLQDLTQALRVGLLIRLLPSLVLQALQAHMLPNRAQIRHRGYIGHIRLVSFADTNRRKASDLRVTLNPSIIPRLWQNWQKRAEILRRSPEVRQFMYPLIPLLLHPTSLKKPYRLSRKVTWQTLKLLPTMFQAKAP